MTFNYVSHTMLQYTVNKILDLIAAIDTSGSGGSSSGPTQEEVDAKETALVIETKSSGTTLTAEAGKYYRLTYTVGTLAITLPTMQANATKPVGLMLSFMTGSSPAVTFSSAGSQTIKYYSDYKIEASKTYELNCMWNGSMWIIAYGTIG